MLPFVFLMVQDIVDQAFVGQIYERYRRLIYKITGEYATSPDEQQDLFQLALLRLMINTDVLYELPEAQRSSYIGTLAKNAALNYIKHKNVVLKHTAAVEEDELIGGFSLSPEDILLRQEKWELMMQAIGMLSSSDRLVLLGKLFMELSDKEMAATLGCKPQSVSMKLTRAKRRAKQQYMRIVQDEES